jgi:hypothetical protein
MSLVSNFVQVINPPSRWWRRGHKLQITLWPDWLAQALCPHKTKTFFSDFNDVDDDSTIWRCEDCFKFNFPPVKIQKEKQ